MSITRARLIIKVRSYFFDFYGNLEFLMAAVEKRKLVSSERLNKVFKMFDQDDNGYIEADDL